MSASPASPWKCALLRGWKGLVSLGIWEEGAHMGVRRDNTCDVFPFFCGQEGKPQLRVRGTDRGRRLSMADEGAWLHERERRSRTSEGSSYRIEPSAHSSISPPAVTVCPGGYASPAAWRQEGPDIWYCWGGRAGTKERRAKVPDDSASETGSWGSRKVRRLPDGVGVLGSR